MEKGQPEGGQWNYDKNNRKKWKGNRKPSPIPKTSFRTFKMIEQAGVKTIGK